MFSNYLVLLHNCIILALVSKVGSIIRITYLSNFYRRYKNMNNECLS